MNSTRWLSLLGLLWVLLYSVSAVAHENLPASLILRESSARVFEVLWRVPQTQGSAPAIAPHFPADCVAVSAPLEQPTTLGAKALQWEMRCEQALPSGTQIQFEGQALTLVDVLVRVAWLDGRQETQIARPRSPAVTLGAVPAQGLAVSAYLGLGVAHILGGIDHLLFVFCLILLVPGVSMLLKTITAFTLAHSLTLGLAALGVVHVPAPPVEAVIALSILFLCRELAHASAPKRSLTARQPWVVAFIFGLLHGFGFAGALAEVGLPQDAIPSALFLFNVGVEAGQLAFVAGVWPLLWLVRRWHTVWPGWALPVPVYSVGTVAAFWWLQRMAPVLGLTLA